MNRAKQEALLCGLSRGTHRNPASRFQATWYHVLLQAVELCFTPANASWANPIEPQSGPLRTFVLGGSDHRNHPALARRLQDYLRWRNAHARHPDVLAAQRRECARVRSQRQQRWARPPGPKPHNRRT